MKKIILFLIALFVFALSISVQFIANADPFSKEVQDLKAASAIGKVKISWTVSDISDVAKIQVDRTNPDNGEVEKVGEFRKDVKSAEFEVPPLATVKVSVKLVSNTGSVSDGKTIEVTAKHKNIVFDECEGRQLAIYLPDGYNTEKKKYPVVYMHDGQNLFSKYVAPGGSEWQIDEVLNRLISQGKMEKVIVVGIYNSGNRELEYTPYFDYYRNGGYAKDYAAFIVKRIIPYIEGKYRALKGRDNRAVMGSSFGGVLSFFMISNYPDVFSMAGVISPAFGYADCEQIKEAAREPKKNIKLWLDAGELEPWILFSTRLTVDALIKKGYTYGDDLLYYEDKGAEHNEDAWSKRVEYPFIYFKGKSAKKVTNLQVNLTTGRDGSPINIGQLFFNHINAFADFDNGLRYSLYGLAEYKLLDNLAGKVDKTGELKLKQPGQIKVSVKYKNLEKKVTLDVKEIN